MRRIEEDGEQIMEAGLRKRDGDFKRVCCEYVHALVEEAVAAHTVSAEAAYSVRNLEGRPAIDTGSLHPRCLAGRVVGHLVLEEDVRAAIPVPDDLIFLVMLDEEAVGGDVIPVYDQAGIRGVGRPSHACAVVRAPSPDVIEDDIVAVDYQT